MPSINEKTNEILPRKDFWIVFFYKPRQRNDKLKTKYGPLLTWEDVKMGFFFFSTTRNTTKINRIIKGHSSSLLTLDSIFNQTATLPWPKIIIFTSFWHILTLHFVLKRCVKICQKLKNQKSHLTENQIRKKTHCRQTVAL